MTDRSHLILLLGVSCWVLTAVKWAWTTAPAAFGVLGALVVLAFELLRPRTRLPGPERLALATVAVIGLIVVDGLVLNIVLRLSRPAWLATLLLEMVAVYVACLARPLPALTSSFRSDGSLHAPPRRPRGRGNFVYWLSAGGALAVLAVTVSLSVLSQESVTQTPFTTLSLTTGASGAPGLLPVTVRVTSGEGRTRAFDLTVQGGASSRSLWSFSLTTGSTFTVRVPRSGRPFSADLFTSGWRPQSSLRSGVPYRYVTLAGGQDG